MQRKCSQTCTIRHVHVYMIVFEKPPWGKIIIEYVILCILTAISTVCVTKEVQNLLLNTVIFDNNYLQYFV